MKDEQNVDKIIALTRSLNSKQLELWLEYLRAMMAIVENEQALREKLND